MRLHTLSFLGGIGSAVLVALLTGAQTSVPLQSIPTSHSTVVGLVPGSWWRVVQITPSTPFVVPIGSHYVVSLLDGTINDLRIDGGMQRTFGPFLQRSRSFRTAPEFRSPRAQC